jgi:hypothetical protein
MCGQAKPGFSGCPERSTVEEVPGPWAPKGSEMTAQVVEQARSSIVLSSAGRLERPDRREEQHDAEDESDRAD